MIKSSSAAQINDRAGILLIILGIIPGRFMMIRPNRIEEGPLLSLPAAMGGLTFLFAAVFLVVLLIIGMRDRYKKIYQYLLLPAVLILYSSFLILTGLSANFHLAGLGRAARVSLGISFWLIMVGILFILSQTMVSGSRSGIVRFSAPLLVLLISGVCFASGILDNISIVKELSAKSDRILSEMIRHLQLAIYSSLSGLILSLFLAVRGYRKPETAGRIKTFVNIMQIIPTLAFLGLIMIPLTFLSNQFPVLKELGISGIGFFPAYIVLTMYSLLPITNTVLAGLKSIDQDILAAALGMGMTEQQKLLHVELPLSLPAIYTGYRTALVQGVGNTILAGLVGGGGIGSLLFLGLAQSAPDLVVISALLVVLTAFILNTVLSAFEPFIFHHYNGERTL